MSISIYQYTLDMIPAIDEILIYLGKKNEIHHYS